MGYIHKLAVDIYKNTETDRSLNHLRYIQMNLTSCTKFLRTPLYVHLDRYNDIKLVKRW